TLIYQVLPYIVVLGVSTVGYLIANHFVMAYLGIESKNHALNMMTWQSSGFKVGMYSLLKTLRNVVFRPNEPTQYLAYNFGVLIATLLLIPVSIRFLLKRKKNHLTAFLALTTLFVGGFGMIIALAGLPTLRSMAPQFPFLAAFLFFYSSLYYRHRYMKTLIFILVLFFGFVQYKDSSNLLFSEDMTYEEDQRKMIQIDQTIKNLKLENAPSYKLIIVGTSPPKNKFNLSAHADLVGVSMFSFAYSNDMGSYYVNANIISMMDILGMHYESPT